MSEFKVGDLVYCPLLGEKIIRIEHAKDCPKPLVVKNNYVAWFLDCTGNPNYAYNSGMPFIFHATRENYELLSKLYPNVEFEPPRKKPKEIIKAMLESGQECVPCYTSETEKVLKSSYKKELIVGIKNNYFVSWAGGNKFAVPFDPKTGKVIVDYVNGQIVLESGNADE